MAGGEEAVEMTSGSLLHMSSKVSWEMIAFAASA